MHIEKPVINHTISRYWTRDSSILLGAFFLVVFLIVYIWWPLAEAYLAFVDWEGSWWLYIDWLLIGIFVFMTITIMAGANLKVDALIVFVGVFGGLAIEAWGTQTNLWFYYTNERPPLWIIPAWPIASLSIDRVSRLFVFMHSKISRRKAAIHPRKKGVAYRFPVLERALYWTTFAAFLALMLVFVAPTIDKPYTIFAILICLFVILNPGDQRFAWLTFLAGTGLGYFLELWGTTRQCWTYYTFATPPLFAVLAHGMAAVIFWRSGVLLKTILSAITRRKRLASIERAPAGEDHPRIGPRVKE